MANRRRSGNARRAVRKRTTARFDFAQRMRSARAGLGLTQEAVATRAGITAKFLSQVENGHQAPSVTVAQRVIVDGLGISLGEFYNDTPPKDEVAKIRALLADKPTALKRKALDLVRALCRD